MQEAQDDVPTEETGTCLNESVKKENLRVTDITGGHGPWQFRHWTIFFLASLCCSMHLFSTLPLMNYPSCQCSNTTADSNLQQLPKCGVSNCSKRNEILWNELSNLCFSPLPSNTPEYAEEDDEKCSNVGIVIYAKLLFAVGSIIAVVGSYHVMNRFGRRSVSLTSCFLLLSSSVAGIWAFAPGPYLILKIVLSASIVSVYLITAFSLADCVTEEFRLLYFYTGHISWGLAHFFIPLFLWILPSWRTFNIILTIPCCLLLIIVCFLPETAESYASRGLWTRAHKVIRKAARCNGFSAQDVEKFSPNLILHQSNENCESDFRCSLKNYRSLLEQITLFIIGFLSSYIYFTSLWLTDWLEIKRGSYFSLLGTTEIAAVFVLLFFSYFIPTRRLWGVTSCIASILLIIMYTKEKQELPRFSRSIFIPQMFFASSSWTVILLHILSQPLNTHKVKYKVQITGIGLCIGLLAAALTDMQKLGVWNRNLLLFISVPNLLVGLCIGIIPSKYLSSLNF